MGQIVRFVAMNRTRKREALAAEPEALDREVGEEGPAKPRWSGARWAVARAKLPPDQQHFDDRVTAGLTALTDVARACLLLRTVDGLEYTEIAEAPFADLRGMALLKALASQPVDLPPVSPPLRGILRRLVQLDVARRTPSAGALLEELDGLPSS